MAERLANGPYIAIQQTKANLREAMKGTLESTLEAEALNQARNFQTEDMIEGVVAFLQKRPANWKGK
jgi:2-(1,2-epoxy-1,2-dihydrophenyl)acetyl-CoA isomerase